MNGINNILNFCKNLSLDFEEINSINRIQKVHHLLQKYQPLFMKNISTQELEYIHLILSEDSTLLDGKFGDKNLKKTNLSGQILEFIFWSDTTTTIHDHSFSGIFVPLAGKRKITEFNFSGSSGSDQVELAPGVEKGVLEISTKKNIHESQTFKISRNLIHQIFHIEPSITLVIRDPCDGVQHDYLPTIRIRSDWMNFYGNKIMTISRSMLDLGSHTKNLFIYQIMYSRYFGGENLPVEIVINSMINFFESGAICVDQKTSKSIG